MCEEVSIALLYLPYDYVYIHQIGPDQEGFFHFCEKEVLPKFH
jgi:hypothetical protein